MTDNIEGVQMPKSDEGKKDLAETNREEKGKPATENGAQLEVIEEEKEKSLQDLKAEIDQLRMETARNLDGWQRARAEFANYKRRQEENVGRLRDDLQAEIIKELFPVLDDFELAFASIPEDAKSREEAWINGFRLIQRKLLKMLDDHSVELIEAEGQFDPNLHEALTYENNADHKEGQIIQVIRHGYRLGERVLRPALVRVSK